MAAVSCRDPYVTVSLKRKTVVCVPKNGTGTMHSPEALVSTDLVRNQYRTCGDSGSDRRNVRNPISRIRCRAKSPRIDGRTTPRHASPPLNNQHRHIRKDTLATMGMNSGAGSALQAQIPLPQFKGHRQGHPSTHPIRARNNRRWNYRIISRQCACASLIADNTSSNFIISRPRTPRGHIISPRCLSVASSSAMASSVESPSKKALVVVGSANADLVVHVGRLPLPGETMAATEFNTFPGGKVGMKTFLGMHCSF